MTDLEPTPIDVPLSLATFDDGTAEIEYHGQRVWKLAADLERYRAIVEATRPRVIVETGTRYGGSALWFARELGVDVISVDLDLVVAPVWGLPITFVRGNSLDAITLHQVTALIAGRRTMVSLDSDHHARHVLAEIAAYGPLVSDGCYLVVEDGIFDFAPERLARRGGFRIPEAGGPYRAVETLADDPQWTRDLDIEGMAPLSHFPAGWWRRG